METLMTLKSPPTTQPIGFVDLTPIDNADIDGSYADALAFALDNKRIKNIAITGPYGSGKSSIIKTFQKGSEKNFLNISLASFKDGKSESTLIERSILQQMLYGADASVLPFSRFKRITTPSLPMIKSLLFVLSLLSFVILGYFNKEIFSADAGGWVWGGGGLLITFVITMLVVLTTAIYESSFSMSLKKFSLKNMEMERGNVSEESILNRHLDEIIYFFQATNYDVVVIEDLDRFGSPDIFVKLREINKLINDNEKTSGDIKFLYALKDDMFAHKSRAKFFDIIIPVVPIINSSNSLEKMHGRLNEFSFSANIDKQFLREVSLYIYDLRLIHNIFNEFIVYYDRLETEGLDLTKLLAMMIYKNVYPGDFEKLHNGGGALYEICKKQPEYIQNSREMMKEKISDLRHRFELSEAETANSIQELMNLYLGYIVTHSIQNQPIYGIFCDNSNIIFSQFTSYEVFEGLFSEQNIRISTQPNNYNSIPINKSFSQIEEEINPGETFLDRKKNIENKLKLNRTRLQQQIHSIEKEINELPSKKISTLIQNSDLNIDGIIKGQGIDDRTLLKYLVLNGYLDNNYYLYISNFHEGRITKNDHDFLVTIRSFNQPEPNQQIDTPEEVCGNMRPEDFGQKYVLNVTLIEYLLEKMDDDPTHIHQAIQFISQNFEQSQDFLGAYFVSGKYLEKFIQTLSRLWPGIAIASISSSVEEQVLSHVLGFVDSNFISQEMNADNQLTTFFSEQGHTVLATHFNFLRKYNALKRLNVRFNALGLFENNKPLVKYAYKENLYTITAGNMLYILQIFSDCTFPEKANYTSISTAGSDGLKRYVEENIKEYVENVFLALPENVAESETAIKALLNHGGLDNDLKEKIISKQELVFDSFECIPESLWPHLLMEEKTDISWKNISTYLESDENKAEITTELLGRQHIVDQLSSESINDANLADDAKKRLSLFIFKNAEIDDANYERLITCLPYYYPDFPTEISEKKSISLIAHRTVRLNEKSFISVSHNSKLCSLLISKNFKEYTDEKEAYPIDDDVRELLLDTEITDKGKVSICMDITSDGVQSSEKLSSLVVRILLSNNVDCSIVDSEVLSSAIINTQDNSDSIKLLIRCFSHWDEGMVMEVLAQLPKPFKEIAIYGKRPRLDRHALMMELAKQLKENGFISSFNTDHGYITINTFKSSNH